VKTKKRKRLRPEEVLLLEAGAIKRSIHLDEPPRTDKEVQAQAVMGGIKAVVETLLNRGVDISVVETSLLWWLLRFVSFNRDVSDVTFDTWIANMTEIAEKLAAAMKQLNADIDDDGPTLAMRALGNKLDSVKALIDKEQLSRLEVERQTEMAMLSLHVFYEYCCDNLLDGNLIETSFFYYWLRASTINAGVTEDIFQKIERNWTEAVKRKDLVFDKLVSAR
jgi:hypothetical protein